MATLPYAGSSRSGLDWTGLGPHDRRRAHPMPDKDGTKDGYASLARSLTEEEKQEIRAEARRERMMDAERDAEEWEDER